MKKTAALVVLLALASAGPAKLLSQETLQPLTLTLDEAIAMALLQNPSHQATQEKEAEARALARQAFSRFLPTLSGQGQNTLAEKLFFLEFPSMVPGEPPQRIAIDFTKDYQGALAFSLPVFAGGRIIAGYKQATLGVKASLETIRQSEMDTVLGVKKAFYGYLLARDFSSVADEALTLAEKFYENVKNLHEVGMASKFDLLLSEVRVANLRPQAIKARNSVQVAELGLKTVLGLDVATPLTVKGELLPPGPGDPGQDLVDQALAQRPEIRQLDFQRSIAGQSLKIARGGLLPSLAIGGTYSFWGDRLNLKRGNWQTFYTVTLNLNLPIFSAYETQAQIAQAQASMRELDWTRKGVADLISLEVRQAILEVGQSRETLRSQEKNVEQAREAVRIAGLNYAEGLVTNLDVQTAQVALSQARTNYSQALYDCAISDAQLERAIGKNRPAGRSN